MEKISVFVTDDHQIVRDGIVALIEENDQFIVCGQAANCEETLNRIRAMEAKPDVILMDINMPVIDGIECTARLFREFREAIKVIALTMVKDNLHIRQMLRAGASGYVLKNCNRKELYQAIREVVAGKSYLTSALPTENRASVPAGEGKADPFNLSRRELEVLRLIARDLSNREIADELSISVRTIESHKQNLLAKTGSRNIAGLIMLAVRHRLVDIIDQEEE